MRLCTYFTEQVIHRSEHADVLGSSGIAAASLGERLGSFGNSQLGLLLTKREAYGLNYEDAFNNPLLCLMEIFPDVKGQLVWLVAAALNHLIAGHTETADFSVDNYLEKAVSEVIANTNPNVHSASAAVAKALYESRYLDSVALSAIFRNDDFRLFEAAIVHLTGIDIRLVRRLILETGGGSAGPS
jgi:hypothetical protein